MFSSEAHSHPEAHKRQHKESSRVSTDLFTSPNLRIPKHHKRLSALASTARCILRRHPRADSQRQELTEGIRESLRSSIMGSAGHGAMALCSPSLTQHTLLSIKNCLLLARGHDYGYGMRPGLGRQAQIQTVATVLDIGRQHCFKASACFIRCEE